MLLLGAVLETIAKENLLVATQAAGDTLLKGPPCPHYTVVNTLVILILILTIRTEPAWAVAPGKVEELTGQRNLLCCRLQVTQWTLSRSWWWSQLWWKSQCNLFSTTQLRDQLLTGLRERGVSLQWWLLWQWWWWLWWWWWWWWWWQHPEGSCRWMWGGRHQVETGACLPGTLSSSSSSSRSDHHYHPHHPRNLYHHLDVNIILPSNQGFTCIDRPFTEWSRQHLPGEAGRLIESCLNCCQRNTPDRVATLATLLDKVKATSLDLALKTVQMSKQTCLIQSNDAFWVFNVYKTNPF